jgi:MFS family permease
VRRLFLRGQPHTRNLHRGAVSVRRAGRCGVSRFFAQRRPSSGSGLWVGRLALKDRLRDPNIVRVYVATLLLGIAYGMALSRISLMLRTRGFDEGAIGTLGAWFAGGILALSLPMGHLIRRFSAKRTLVAVLVGYAMTVTVFPFLPSYASIAAVRVIDGACSVGVWVSSETILLARSNRHNKAFVTSLYTNTMAVGYILGPLAAFGLVRVVPDWVIFVTAGVLALASAAYVALRLDAALPKDAELEAESSEGDVTGSVAAGPAGELGGLTVLRRIRNSCYATFAYGYFQSSVVLFLPLYMTSEKGILEEQTTLNTAFFAAGMLLFANYFGRIGDRHGHLKVMRLLATVGMSMILGFVFLDRFEPMAIAVFVAGATLASMSPLSLALQGVAVAARDYPRANAYYNAFYGAGMLLGPPISGFLFSRQGGGAMLYHLAALWFGFILCTILWYRDDPAARRSDARAAVEG